MKKYQIIYADPPWKYGMWGKGSSKSALSEKYNDRPVPMPYQTMSIQDIKELPVNAISDVNCELYLWTTQRYLPVAFDVMNCWGFKYCTTLTWCKKPMGKGQGGLFCPTTEFLLHGRIGKMPIRGRIDTTWWEVKRQNMHSKKPAFFRELIETVSNLPRIELFARQKTPGWDVWGNEVESDIDLDFIKLYHDTTGEWPE